MINLTTETKDIGLYSTSDRSVFLPNGKAAFECLDASQAEKAAQILNFERNKILEAIASARSRALRKGTLVTFLAQCCTQAVGHSVRYRISWVLTWLGADEEPSNPRHVPRGRWQHGYMQPGSRWRATQRIAPS